MHHKLRLWNVFQTRNVLPTQKERSRSVMLFLLFFVSGRKIVIFQAFWFSQVESKFGKQPFSLSHLPIETIRVACFSMSVFFPALPNNKHSMLFLLLLVSTPVYLLNNFLTCGSVEASRLSSKFETEYLAEVFT